MTSKQSDRSHRNAWTKADIRRARQTPLKPVLEAMGYQLQPLRNGNYHLCRLDCDIVIKDHFWIDKDADASTRAGNAIDFLVQVEGMSFAQAMETLCEFSELPETS